MTPTHEKLISMMKAHHRDIINEADNNPDKWYELYTVTGDCSETVESADTFDEIVQHLSKYELNEISIDIWENRQSPNNISTPLTSAKGLTIHSCSYGHKIVIIFDSVCIADIVYNEALGYVPNNVWDAINNSLSEMNLSGTFDVGEYIDSQSNDQIHYNGSWRVIQSAEYDFLARMVLWFNNYGDSEGLYRELFDKYFGTRMGEHFYSKWHSTYSRDILKMIGYFGLNSSDGKIFMEMIKEQMAKYEERSNNRKSEEATHKAHICPKCNSSQSLTTVTDGKMGFYCKECDHKWIN